jgi:hypothetical protein
MTRKIAVLSLLWMTYSFSQERSGNYFYQFDIGDAAIDASLNVAIRSEFEDDDPDIELKSISVDLNNDGIKEKLIPNEILCGKGGCPWLVYDTKKKITIGKIDGATLIIDTEIVNGYLIIETFGRAGDDGSAAIYKYAIGKYSCVKDIPLHGKQINEYFESKRKIKK